MKPAAAFFDIDHTIIRYSSGGLFLVEAFRQGIVPLHLVLSIPFYYAQYRLFRPKWNTRMKPVQGLDGIHRSSIEKISREIFQKKYLQNVFPEIQQRIEQLQAQGTDVILATSSIDILVEPLSSWLNADHLIASKLEFSEGKTTGCFEGKPVFSEEKLKRVREYAEGKKIALSECAFYSDSIHDLPLLEAVGTPVAVNPDARLYKLAVSKNWEIIRPLR